MVGRVRRLAPAAPIRSSRCRLNCHAPCVESSNPGVLAYARGGDIRAATVGKRFGLFLRTPARGTAGIETTGYLFWSDQLAPCPARSLLRLLYSRPMRDGHRVHVRRVDTACTPAAAAVSFSDKPGLLLLESICRQTPYARYSILACRPVDHLVADAASDDAQPRQAWQKLSASIRLNGDRPYDLPFTGGWAGYLPYEFGEAHIGMAARSAAAPGTDRPRMGLYDTTAIYDHRKRRWYIVACELEQSCRPVKTRLEELEAGLRAARRFEPYVQEVGGGLAPPVPLPTPNMHRQDYLRRVSRAQAHIRAGDIYQLNLTQRFTTEAAIDPVELYLRLRQCNRSAFAALIRDGHRWVLSSSPELFLNCDGRRVVTRPIKGTAPRPRAPADVTAARRALAASEKDRAELNMIIDLLRNDLGRVCEFGSIRVAAEGDIEVHPTVLHRVATIIGRLRGDATPVGLLASSFPGGSVTGCPKIRAMQIIRELEPTPRDVYCGAIGYLGLDGAMCLNVAIRTMLYDQGQLHIYSGGAITADSNPEAEYREVLAKAEGMFRAIGHTTADLAAGAKAVPAPLKVTV